MEVGVTDGHPRRGTPLTEGTDEEWSDAKNQDGATKIKFLRSFLV